MEFVPHSSFEDADEESFVVLGKSLIESDLFHTSADEPIGLAVEEARNIMNKELEDIKEQSLNSQPTCGNKDVTSGQLPKDEPDSHVGPTLVPVDNMQSQEYHLGEVPEIPLIHEGFNASNISGPEVALDLTSLEMHNKVSEIIEENIRLKDTILLNNISMKSHYGHILNWQEDVQRVHQTHKNKILEAKEIIEQLNEDLIQLKWDNTQMKKVMNLQSQELINIENRLKERQEENNLGSNELNKILNNKVEQFELLKNMSLENSLKDEQYHLTEKLEILKNLDIEYKKTLNELQQVKSELATLKATSIVEDNQQVQLMTVPQVSPNLSSAEELANLKTQLVNTQIMLTQVQLEKSDACTLVQKLNSDINELNEKIKELAKFKAELESEQNKEIEYEKKKDSEDYQNLLRINLRMHEEIEKHRKGLGLYVVEDVSIVQAELSKLKADLEIERSAKEIAEKEKERISEEYQNLQESNKQLQKENEELRINIGVYVHKKRDSSASLTNELLKCPKYRTNFQRLNMICQSLGRKSLDESTRYSKLEQWSYVF